MLVGRPFDYVIVVDMNLCSDCNCDVRGTEDGSIVCNEDGQCQCKQNVIGLRCDACPDGFFGLDANNTDGNKLLLISIFLHHQTDSCCNPYKTKS